MERGSRLAPLVLLLCTGPEGVARASEAGPPQALPDTVAVAVLEQWPPHYLYSPEGEATGFAVDVIRAVARVEGMTLRLVPMADFPEAMEALRDGTVDVIPDFGVTRERAAEFSFTRTLDAFRIALFVRDSDPTDESTSLAGGRVGAVAANVGVELARDRYPGAEIVVFDNAREALFELLAAGVDAVVYPEEVFVALARAVGAEGRVRAVPPPLAEVSRAMAVRAEDTTLLFSLDRGLDAVVGSPEHEAISRRWFGSSEPFWTPDRILLGSAGVLFVVLLAMVAWRRRSVGGLARDLSRTLEERDQAREAGRREEERFRTLVETSYEGIVMADDRNQITFVNQRACDLVGLAEEEIIGADLFEYVAEEHRERIAEGVVRRREGLSDAYEVELRRPDGARMRVLLSVAPIENGEGRFAGSVATLADITDRVQAEERIRESELRFRAFVENASDLISTIEEDGTMRYQSPALTRLLGYRPEDLEGTSIFAYLHPDEAGSIRATWNDMLQRLGETVRVGPFRFRHADESWRTFVASITNLLADPAVGAILSNAEDVTERNELERQLRQAQKLEAVGRLASGIAHDFNNLLTVIRAQTDLLLLELENGSPLTDDVTVIQDAADRAAALTSQLLSFSREQMLRPRIVDLDVIVREMASFLRRIIGEDVEILTDLGHDLPPAEVDRGQLEQVLMNLGVNARDAMPGGGTLTISARREHVTEEAALDTRGIEPGTYVVLEVADEGVGMDELTVERAFEPFFTTKEQGKGTGLGLAMAYGFVKQSGGEMHIESEPGRGTSVVIRLPAVEEAPGEVDGRREAPRADVAGTGAILVVEDDESVRRVIRRILEGSGFDVVDVGDVEAGLEVLQRRRDISLVLTDLVLPGTSGLALVEELEASRPDLPVLAMSGYAADAPGRAVKLPPHLPFIQKPFTFERLVESVREALGG